MSNSKATRANTKEGVQTGPFTFMNLHGEAKMHNPSESKVILLANDQLPPQGVAEPKIKVTKARSNSSTKKNNSSGTSSNNRRSSSGNKATGTATTTSSSVIVTNNEEQMLFPKANGIGTAPWETDSTESPVVMELEADTHLLALQANQRQHSTTTSSSNFIIKPTGDSDIEDNEDEVANAHANDSDSTDNRTDIQRIIDDMDLTGMQINKRSLERTIQLLMFTGWLLMFPFYVKRY